MASILLLLIFLSSVGVLVFEFWEGIALTGWQGDKMVVERETQPGPYWFTMALQTFIVVMMFLMRYFVA